MHLFNVHAVPDYVDEFNYAGKRAAVRRFTSLFDWDTYGNDYNRSSIFGRYSSADFSILFPKQKNLITVKITVYHVHGLQPIVDIRLSWTWTNRRHFPGDRNLKQTVFSQLKPTVSSENGNV